MSTLTRWNALRRAARAPLPVSLLAPRAGLFWLLLLVAGLLPRGSQAGGFADCSLIADCAAARAQANALAQSGQLDRALSQYEALYTKYLDPRIWYNIARLLHKQGRPAESITYYRRFIDSGIETDQGRLEKTRALLAQAQQETVTATSNQKLIAEQEAERRSAELATQRREQAPPTPVYKRWWFWVAIGSVAVAGAVGIGIGVATIQPQNPGTPELRPFP